MCIRDRDYFDNTIPPQLIDASGDGDPKNPELGPSQWGDPISATFGNKEGV